MAVISIHSAKGGVGKTTLTINIAAEMAFRGIRTAVLDADLNQHSTRFGAGFCASHPGLPVSFTGGVEPKTFSSQLRDAEAHSDVVIVDLPAGTGSMSFRAVMRSHLVIIPTQRTVLDLRDAARTAAHISDAEEYTRSSIHSALVWTRESPRFESRSERRVREGFLSMLVDPERAFLKSSMMENDAFRAALVDSWAPREFADRSGRQVDRRGPSSDASFFVPRATANAAENISSLTDEILGRLNTIAAGEDPGKVKLRPEHLAEMRATLAQMDTEAA